MSVHGKFIGKLGRKPQKIGGFTTLAIDMRAGLNGPPVEGVNEAYVCLDLEHLDKKEVAEQARLWNEGDLVQLEGQVLEVQKCKCCGEPMFLIGAWSCSRLLS